MPSLSASQGGWVYGSGLMESAMVRMYHEVRRKPDEGTASAAIRVHAQACGFVAYAFNVHPDYVARCVAEAKRDA